MAGVDRGYRLDRLRLAVFTKDPLEHFKNCDGRHDQRRFIVKNLKKAVCLRSIGQHLNPTLGIHNLKD